MAKDSKKNSSFLEDYKKSVAAEKAKDPKAFDKKHSKKPPKVQSK